METQNNTITEDYVSYETAKLLKEKGFDEPLEMLIRKDGTRYHADTNSVSKKRHIMLRNSEINMYSTDLSCPTLQMACKWLREEYNIHISIYIFNRELPVNSVPIYTCDIATEKLSSQEGHLRGIWKTYEEACEAAIKHCLTNML